jgi:hypothetical protein
VLRLQRLLDKFQVDAQLLNVDIVGSVDHATAACSAASRLATRSITRAHISMPRGS